MTTTTANDNLHARELQLALTQEYRSIGPAAIRAALLCMPKSRTKHAQPAVKAA